MPVIKGKYYTDEEVAAAAASDSGGKGPYRDEQEAAKARLEAAKKELEEAERQVEQVGDNKGEGGEKADDAK